MKNKKKNTVDKIFDFASTLYAVHGVNLIVLDTHFEKVYEAGACSSEDTLTTLILSSGPAFWEDLASVEEHELFRRQDINYKPFILTDETGITWIVDFDYADGKIEAIINLGPVFLGDYTTKEMSDRLERYQPSLKQKHSVMDRLNMYPILDLYQLYDYGIMLHYCISGKRIGIGDFVYPQLAGKTDKEKMLPRQHGTYVFETELLEAVRTGNLSCKMIADRFLANGFKGRLAWDTEIRNCRNLFIIITGLCARAAVEGGLSCDTAYWIRDQYVCHIEEADTYEAIITVFYTMVERFARAVSSFLEAKERRSLQIQSACDYIALHLTEKIDLELLAGRAEYHKYYFANKFRRETGLCVADYINQQKLEASCRLLRHTNDSISQISESLRFASPSYFGKLFRQAYGCTPGQYREINKE